MFVESDPLRDFESVFSRLSNRAFSGAEYTPIDAYRRGSDVWVHVDLPGVAADTIDVTVERNVLTIAAERSWQRQDGDQVYLAERRRGKVRRQIHLGDGLDGNNLEADLHDGVLTLRIPVAEQAKPRKVQINRGESQGAIETTATTPA